MSGTTRYIYDDAGTRTHQNAPEMTDRERVHVEALLAASQLILAAAKTLDRVAHASHKFGHALDKIPHLRWLEKIAADLEALARKGPPPP
jgi:hypothetical protein